MSFHLDPTSCPNKYNGQWFSDCTVHKNPPGSLLKSNSRPKPSRHSGSIVLSWAQEGASLLIVQGFWQRRSSDRSWRVAELPGGNQWFHWQNTPKRNSWRIILKHNLGKVKKKKKNDFYTKPELKYLKEWCLLRSTPLGGWTLIISRQLLLTTFWHWYFKIAFGGGLWATSESQSHYFTSQFAFDKKQHYPEGWCINLADLVPVFSKSNM